MLQEWPLKKRKKKKKGLKNDQPWELPGSLVARTQHFHYCSGLDPWFGNWDPMSIHCMPWQKERKKEKEKKPNHLCTLGRETTGLRFPPKQGSKRRKSNVQEVGTLARGGGAKDPRGDGEGRPRGLSPGWGHPSQTKKVGMCWGLFSEED